MPRAIAVAGISPSINSCAALRDIGGSTRRRAPVAGPIGQGVSAVCPAALDRTILSDRSPGARTGGIGDHLRTGIAKRRPSSQAPSRNGDIRGLCDMARGPDRTRRIDEIFGIRRRGLAKRSARSGLFGGAPDDARTKKELRIMAAMSFGIDRFSNVNILGLSGTTQ